MDSELKTAGMKKLPEHKDGVTRFVLENGMTVLLEKNSSSPVAAVNVWVKVGSACEVEGEHGLAHVHEHMVFKGTEKRGVGEIAKMIESNGGDINAFTSFDHTVYFVEIASRFLDTALDVLSDAMENSAFDPNELKKELEVVVEEISRGEDSPMRVLSQKLFDTAYTVHPYGLPVIGTKKSVRSFDRTRVVNFYDKWYKPNNMILVVVGDFKTEEVIPQILKTFGSLKPGPTTACSLPVEPEQKGLKTFVLEKDVQEAYFYLAYHIGSAMDKDTPAADIISNILGGGESSRLYRNVKENKGLVNNIYSYSYTPQYPGLFVISGSFDPANATGALHEIIVEVGKLKNSPVSDDELSRAKVNIESDSIYSKETMNGQAQKLGYFEADAGDYLYEKTYLQNISRVGKNDITKFAKAYFNNENLTIGVLLPSELPDLTDMDITEVVDKAQASQSVSEAPDSPVAAEKKVVLPNGIRVIVKENHGVPTFAVRAIYLGGVRYEDGSNNGISNFIAEMLTRGTSSRSAEQIAAEIESIAGSIQGYSGRNSLGVRVESLSKNFDKAMDIFADVLLNSSFEPEEVERARKEILSELNREGDNMVRTTVNLFLSSLYSTHPYRFNPLGTKENVSAIKDSELKEFFNKLSAPENLVIAVAGDIDSDKVIAEINKRFGSIQKRGFSPLELASEPRRTGIKTSEQNQQDKAQAHIILGFLAPTIYDPDHYALEVLSSILSGQGGRLFLELRDNQSLAYTVTSFLTPGLEAGYFGIYIGTAPDKKDQAIAGIKEQLALVIDKGVTEQELQRAQNYLVGSFEIGLQQNSSQASQIGFDEIYGLGWDSYKSYSATIYSVTREDIMRVVKKYIDLESYVLTIVAPEPGRARSQPDSVR